MADAPAGQRPSGERLPIGAEQIVTGQYEAMPVASHHAGQPRGLWIGPDQRKEAIRRHRLGRAGRRVEQIETFEPL